jgi:hypothetical protein
MNQNHSHVRQNYYARCFSKHLNFVFALALFVGLALVGCKAETETEAEIFARNCSNVTTPSHLYSTISADGKVVAALSYVDYCGKMLVRYKYLDDEKPWQVLPVPRNVDSISFGLKGHELMLTRRTDLWGQSWSELLKWDLDHPDLGPQVLYEAYGLINPAEIAPGEIMVQNCVPTEKKKCHSRLGWQYDIIKNGKLLYRWDWGGPYGNRGNMNFWRADLVMPGQGVLWFKVRGYAKVGEPYPDFWHLTFPGKTAPKFPYPLDEETEYLFCSHRAERCFIEFIENRKNTKGKPFIYNRKVLWKGELCELEGVKGGRSDHTVTANGLFSVMSLDATKDNPRHLVIFKFSPHQWVIPPFLTSVQSRGLMIAV